jgi:hypothetical protein
MHPLPHPLVDRYLEDLGQAMAGAGLPDTERSDIEREIASHFAEALRRGEPLEGTLRRLGPAPELAAAYGVELLLRPRQRGSSFTWRAWVTVATRWFAALLIAVLGLVGAAVALFGVAGLLAALIAPLLPLEPTLRAGWPQVAVGVASLFVATFGALLLRLSLFTARLWRGVRAKVAPSQETS